MKNHLNTKVYFTLFKLGDNVTFKAKEKNDIKLGDFKHVNHN